MKATFGIVLVAVVTGSANAAETAQPAAVARDAQKQAIGDVIFAEPLMETSPQSLRVANQLMSKAFNNGLDLDAYAYLQKLLVQHTLGLAERQPDLATECKSAAVAMTFNLAANTWPGWGLRETPAPNAPNSGVGVSEAQARLGLEAARTNVRLATELGLGPKRRQNGYWILGAQLIAATEFDAAIEAFATSRELAREAGDAVTAMMADGWIHLTNTVAGRDETRRLRTVQESLRAAGDEGAFYADQYDVALDIFAR